MPARRAVLAVAWFGVVAGLVAVVVGWALVSSVERSTGRSLDLSADALATLSDTIGTARGVVDGVDEALGTVAQLTGQVATTYEASDDVLTGAVRLTGQDLPGSLDAMARTFPSLITVADAVDGALRLASRAPFLGIEYDPEVPFGDSIRDLQATVTPIAGELRTFSAALEVATASSDDVSANLRQLEADLTRVHDRVDEAATLFDRYAATTTDARSLADATRTDLQRQARWARALVVVLGLAFAAGQSVPLWHPRLSRLDSATTLEGDVEDSEAADRGRG